VVLQIAFQWCQPGAVRKRAHPAPAADSDARASLDLDAPLAEELRRGLCERRLRHGFGCDFTPQDRAREQQAPRYHADATRDVQDLRDRVPRRTERSLLRPREHELDDPQTRGERHLARGDPR
jgi:hypothetical protein